MLAFADLKPANLLLKANPRDYRGFTVKLADFGFVLHLNEVGWGARLALLLCAHAVVRMALLQYALPS
jgi:hypothetical protein